MFITQPIKGNARVAVSLALQEQLTNLVLFRIDHRLDPDFYQLFIEQSETVKEINIYNKLSHQLKNIKDTSKNTFTEITALNKKGQVFASSDYEKTDLVLSDDLWTKLSEKKGFHVSEVLFDKKMNLLGNRVYIPLYQPKDRFIGYLAVGVDAYYLDLVEYFMEQ